MLRIIAMLLTLSLCNVYANDNNSFIALSYHDIYYGDKERISPNDTKVHVDTLVSHFTWLRDNGYHPVSLAQIREAQNGGRPLPKNAILLTFDDGYISFYTTVYPLLRAYDFPAILAVVGSWLEVPENELVNYGQKKRPRTDFVSWNQLNIIAKSGLVEIASHTFDLHKGILANPQGNEQPAATSLAYDNKNKRYETLAQRQQRVFDDLQKNNQLIQKHTGQKPNTIVWPYGEYSIDLENIARKLGLEHSVSLLQGINQAAHASHIKRVLITNSTELDKLVYRLQNMESHPPVRAAHVDLDYVYDKDPEQQHRNLSALLDRIKQMGISTVYLQAFADSDGDGNADALYFPNRHLPVKADLFNRVAWQLRTRAGVQVYAWLPVLSYILPNTQELRVHQLNGAKKQPVTDEYIRLSPFSLQATNIISEIYEDLSLHAHFDGLIFHDDGYLRDNEDFHPEAVDTMRDILKSPLTAQDIHNYHKPVWKQVKTLYLNNLTQELIFKVKQHKSFLKTARNIYANVILLPESESWFAQNYKNALQIYDYVAVMAMPYLEKADKHDNWYEKLIKKAKVYDPNLEKTVFELQTVDWNTRTKVPNETLKHSFRLLQRNGVKHIAYYPDDFIQGHPDANLIRSTISIIDKPFFKERTYD